MIETNHKKVFPAIKYSMSDATKIQEITTILQNKIQGKFLDRNGRVGGIGLEVTCIVISYKYCAPPIKHTDRLYK